MKAKEFKVKRMSELKEAYEKAKAEGTIRKVTVVPKLVEDD